MKINRRRFLQGICTITPFAAILGTAKSGTPINDYVVSVNPAAPIYVTLPSATNYWTYTVTNSDQQKEIIVNDNFVVGPKETATFAVDPKADFYQGKISRIVTNGEHQAHPQHGPHSKRPSE